MLLQIVDTISRLDIPFDNTLNYLYLSPVIRCSTGHELSTDTRAYIRQDGVAIVPNSPHPKVSEYVETPLLFAVESPVDFLW